MLLQGGPIEVGGFTLDFLGWPCLILTPDMGVTTLPPGWCEIWIYRLDGRLWQRVAVDRTITSPHLPALIPYEASLAPTARPRPTSPSGPA